MRRYTLANTDVKGTLDLRIYETQIIDTVKEVMPKATVAVYYDCYTVEPTPTRSEAIRIGRALSKAELLGRYCIHVPKLFCGTSVNLTNKEDNNHDTSNRLGGHF